MALNRVVLIGRLTRDPEMKYTPAGVPVAHMGLAVQRFTKNESGDYDVDFFDIVAWRRTAEFSANYLKKGRLVSIDGKLQTRSWVAQDGTKRKSVEVVAENIETLERRSEEEGSEGDMGYEAASAPAPAAPAPAAAATSSSSGSGSRRAAPPPPPADDDDEADPFADE